MRYSCIVTIHKPKKSIGYYGSTVAAPVFSSIVEKIYTKTSIKENIKKTNIDQLGELKYKNERLALSEEIIGKMPNLEGMPLMDAIALLENLGLQVTYTGEGVVKTQSVTKGDDLKNINTIALTLG